MRRKLAAGNWKMNGTLAGLDMLADVAAAMGSDSAEAVICPPSAHLMPAVTAAQGTSVGIGAQDCHTESKGAFTGDISAPMIKDIGATYVIVGHSERREAYAESDADVARKAQAAWAADLTAIICIGESEAHRSAGTTLDVIAKQLAGSLPDGCTGENTVVAYEPIWAIGTGKIPTLDQIIEVHDFIRAKLAERFGSDVSDALRLLYGGSVKPDNAADIFKVENVDGALIGGASLKAADFTPILKALSAA
ncbi:triose-phosphate isomerase [Sulfitobacter litoralis]|uniref:triose-phosphate isomerase n=1 Tax=Sulfitobacter litoralis TaxID=335975 RepID=UPI002B275120|nr:triose-phosphate isomerase [Sulfitobacter litoralis]